MQQFSHRAVRVSAPPWLLSESTRDAASVVGLKLDKKCHPVAVVSTNVGVHQYALSYTVNCRRKEVLKSIFAGSKFWLHLRNVVSYFG